MADRTRYGPLLRPDTAALDAPRPSVRSSARRLGGLALKAAVSAALILWILRRADLADVWRAATAADPLLLAAAWSMHFVGYSLTSLRWRILLRVHDAEAGLPFLIRSCMAAAFFNNLLPSIVGGDVVRAYDSWRLGCSRTAAVSVVLLDRIIGILGLAAVAFVALTASARIADALPMLRLAILAGAAAVILLLAATFARPRRLIELAGLARLDRVGRVRGMLAALDEALMPYRGRTDALGAAIVISIVLQCVVVLQYALVAHTISLDVPLAAMFLVVPLSLVATLIPVSINGIGIRENAFLFLLGLYAVTPAHALAFTWLMYGIILSHGLLGGLVYAARR